MAVSDPTRQFSIQYGRTSKHSHSYPCTKGHLVSRITLDIDTTDVDAAFWGLPYADHWSAALMLRTSMPPKYTMAELSTSQKAPPSTSRPTIFISILLRGWIQQHLSAARLPENAVETYFAQCGPPYRTCSGANNFGKIGSVFNRIGRGWTPSILPETIKG